MSSEFPTSVAVEKGWATVNRVWGVEVAAVTLVWVLLPRLVSPLGGSLEPSGLFTILFLVVSLFDLGLSWWIKSRAFVQASQTAAGSVEEVVGRIAGPSLVAMVLPATPAVLGAVLYLLLGSFAVLAGFCFLSLVGMYVLRPRLEEWQDLVRRTRIDANRHS